MLREVTILTLLVIGITLSTHTATFDSTTTTTIKTYGARLLNGIVAGDVLTLELTMTKSSASFVPVNIFFQIYDETLSSLQGYGSGYPSGTSFTIPTTTTPSAFPVITHTFAASGNYFVVLPCYTTPTYLQQFQWIAKKNGVALFHAVGALHIF